MKGTTAALLIAIGLVVLWIAITGRLDNVAQAWAALKGAAGTKQAASGTTLTIPSPPLSVPSPISLPTPMLPALPTLPPILS